MNAIFVYGILKHRPGAQPARVKGYRLIDMGSYPAAIPDLLGTVVGELIFVSDETVDEFDVIEGHPDFYIRKDVKVVTGEGSSVESTDAQMYVVNETYWERESEETNALDIYEGDEGSACQLYEYHA